MVKIVMISCIVPVADRALAVDMKLEDTLTDSAQDRISTHRSVLRAPHPRQLQVQASPTHKPYVL